MWHIADKIVTSRLLLGTARYPSLQILSDAVRSSGTEIITISLRRQLSNPSAKYFNSFPLLSAVIGAESEKKRSS